LTLSSDATDDEGTGTSLLQIVHRHISDLLTEKNHQRIASSIRNQKNQKKQHQQAVTHAEVKALTPPIYGDGPFNGLISEKASVILKTLKALSTDDTYGKFISLFSDLDTHIMDTGAAVVGKEGEGAFNDDLYNQQIAIVLALKAMRATALYYEQLQCKFYASKRWDQVSALFKVNDKEADPCKEINLKSKDEIGKRKEREAVRKEYLCDGEGDHIFNQALKGGGGAALTRKMLGFPSDISMYMKHRSLPLRGDLAEEAKIDGEDYNSKYWQLDNTKWGTTNVQSFLLRGGTGAGDTVVSPLSKQEAFHILFTMADVYASSTFDLTAFCRPIYYGEAQLGELTDFVKDLRTAYISMLQDLIKNIPVLVDSALTTASTFKHPQSKKTINRLGFTWK